MTVDVDLVAHQAQALRLTVIYYYATAMVANGRCTLLTHDGALPQVNVNPASVDALVDACEAAGIACKELTPEMAGIKGRQ